MGLKLSDVEVGSKITLLISNESNSMNIDAIIKKNIKDDISIIALCLEMGRPLNFNNVKIEVEYAADEGPPFLWRTAQVIYYKSEYVLQVKNDGIRHNRRESFRVGVAVVGRMRHFGKGELPVMVRDISISGFSIADRKKELNLKVGDEVKLYFEDLGHVLDLAGRVVRTEEREDMIIYGFEIGNLCKDLSSYISVKQRHKR